LFQEKRQLLTYADGINVFDANMDTGKKITENYLLAGKYINRKTKLLMRKITIFFFAKECSTKSQ
jgi:hypothetical protein